MIQKKFQYIFGPLYSWRLGISLGIDPISSKEKTCNFDCRYCQLGKTSRFVLNRKIFVPTSKIIDEIKAIPKVIDFSSTNDIKEVNIGSSSSTKDRASQFLTGKEKTQKIDYLTLTANGEPTLAKNLGDIILALRKIRKEKIAVITNASLMDSADVRKDLSLADFVIAKLDADSQETLTIINRPVTEAGFGAVLKGIKNFRDVFRGKLALQIMFIKENKDNALAIAKIARSIQPDEIHLDTPLRACGVKPLSKKEMNAIKIYFKDLPVLMVYDKTEKEVRPLNLSDTIKRHGHYKSK